MKYTDRMEHIPQDKRKEINQKLLYLIEQGLCEEYDITQEDIFNSYTGDGGLHGLDFNDYQNFHSYTQAKQEIEQGQFYTPHKLSQFLVECIRPLEKHIIADLTCGMGNFFNYVPNEMSVYGTELDSKSYKVAKYLYPNANIENKDIRLYEPNVKFDVIFGNPPFNLKWGTEDGKYLSQLYYCMKASKMLKQGGILALIVPSSFLADEFTDGSMIEEMNQRFNFIGQYNISRNIFKEVGVENFKTKVMFFQRKSKHLQNEEYTLTDIKEVEVTEEQSRKIFEEMIQPKLEEKEQVETKIKLENLKEQGVDREFEYKVNKMLYDIKRHKYLKKYYEKNRAYVERFYTQEKPSDMEYEEWLKIRITKNKVIRYLKNTIKKQHEKEEDKIELVRTRYGLKLKAYSHKTKIKLSKMECVKEMTFTEMIQRRTYPFKDRKYYNLFLKKLREHDAETGILENKEVSKEIQEYLKELKIEDKENKETIQLNEIQKDDTGKMLTKRYGYLQWGTGSGKSISAIAQMKYRLQKEQVRNVFIVAPAIAINNNWDDILKSYDMDYIRINSLKDMEQVEKGQIVIMTFNMLMKYERQVKNYIKKQSKKVMLVLDEADNIANPSSKRTKAVLNCFRRVKYKVLMSATSTRNNIAESFTAFELLYNNSHNLISKSPMYYVENKKLKEIEEKENPYYLKPIPAYKKGHTLFKRLYSPEKATVFGVGKQNQDIYNKDDLKEIIDYTMITRTFEEVSGKDIYKIVQNTCKMGLQEKELYKVIVEEFYKLTHLYGTTGSDRKDSMLRIIRQLNSLLKACVIPNDFKDYAVYEQPTKANILLDMLKEWDNEIVSIGCTHVKVVQTYKNYIQERFPNRPLYVITGDITLNKRKDIIRELKESGNGILICTQQSLSSSMNIDFVNKIIMLEMQWNLASMHQYFARFIRYTSTEQKEVHFITVENTIETNLLKLILNKEKLNSFMKNDEIGEIEVLDRFGIDFDIMSMLLTRETDKDGKSYISWGEQKAV